MQLSDTSPPKRPVAQSEVVSVWQVRTNLDFRQAEELLDWLERCGCTCREVIRGEDGQSLTVRWRA